MKDKNKVLVSGALLLSLALANIISPNRAFSNKENRFLKVLPKFDYKSLISGKFGSEFEDYTSDQFVFRDQWITLKTLGDLSLLKKDNGRVYFGKDGFLFDLKEDFSYEDLEKNINNINKFLKKAGNYNINIKIGLIPGKAQVLVEKLPKYGPSLDENLIKDILEKGLSKNGQTIDFLEVLSKNKDQYIYYRTDHHWTSKGAYLAYKAYIEDLGLEAIPEEDFKIETISNDFWGTIYRKANYYKGDPDQIFTYNKGQVVEEILVNTKDKMDSLYDDSYLDKLDKYSYFLSGDQALLEIKTSVKNGKNLLLVKDSFANSMIPFLVHHFENLTVVDPRYYKASLEDLIIEKDINDLLILFNVENFSEKGRFLPLGI